ncbi:MAG: preprotein translocase subunit SecE [Candidatus Xenobium sp.]
MATSGGTTARKKSARRPGAGTSKAERPQDASAPRDEAGREGKAPAGGDKRPPRKSAHTTVATPAGGFKERLGQFLRFLKSVRTEMKRVTWPSAKEVRAATIVVMVTLLVVSSYMGIVDWLLTLLFGTPVATGY